MIRHYCDMCGKELTYGELEEGHNKYRISAVERSERYDWYDAIELCEKCYEKVEKALDKILAEAEGVEG